MSHEALEKTNKGRSTYPNVWFVGVVPRRNPELVVAVLWQNGEFSYYPARIGAKVIAAYVDKKRRLAHNLPPEKAGAPQVDVGAVWTAPDSRAGQKNSESARINSGHFFVDGHGIVAENQLPGQSLSRPGKNPVSLETSKPRSRPSVNARATPAELVAALPERRPWLKSAPNKTDAGSGNRSR